MQPRGMEFSEQLEEQGIDKYASSIEERLHTLGALSTSTFSRIMGQAGQELDLRLTGLQQVGRKWGRGRVREAGV